MSTNFTEHRINRGQSSIYARDYADKGGKIL
jgi:hypothetical protein